MVDLQWEKLIKFLVKKETIQNFLVKVQSFYQGETRKKILEILLFLLTIQNKSNGEHARYKMHPLNFAHQVSPFYFLQNMPLILLISKFWYFLTAAGWHPDKEWTFIFIFGIFLLLCWRSHWKLFIKERSPAKNVVFRLDKRKLFTLHHQDFSNRDGFFLKWCAGALFVF